MTGHRAVTLALLLSACAAPAARAQTSPQLGVAIATQEVRRGLDWSGGRASASADLTAGLAGFDLFGRAAAARGAPRHGGADAILDVEAGRSFRSGGFDFGVSLAAHLFAGARERGDFWEAGARGGFTLGPAQLRVGGLYAPAQSTIGGDNLYLYADMSGGIPATPFTLRAGVGRSTGRAETGRAARLRPGGSYVDWKLAVAHTKGRLSLEVAYLGNDVRRRDRTDGRFDGDRLMARARFAFGTE